MSEDRKPKGVLERWCEERSKGRSKGSTSNHSSSNAARSSIQEQAEGVGTKRVVQRLPAFEQTQADIHTAKGNLVRNAHDACEQSRSDKRSSARSGKQSNGASATKRADDDVDESAQ